MCAVIKHKLLMWNDIYVITWIESIRCKVIYHNARLQISRAVRTSPTGVLPVRRASSLSLSLFSHPTAEQLLQ